MSEPGVIAADRTVGGRERGRLVFGRMYEDADLDAALLPPGRVLCIASAGDTALRLAADGHEVVAVDADPAQVRYTRDRLAGAPARDGSVERLLGRARTVLRHTAWRRADLPAFCEMTDGVEQLAVWRDTFDTRVFRSILAATLSPLPIRSAGFGVFTGGVAGRFDVVMRHRLRDGLSRHANRDNPYLRALLTGEPVPAPTAVDVSRIEVRCADLVEYLEAAPAGAFAGFTLSNVEDGVDAAYSRRLRAAVRRCAAPGAVAVRRSFRESADPGERRLATRDRNLFWGGIRVEPC